MARSSFWVKGDRTGQVDWGDSGLTDEDLERKASEVLPKLFERMRTEDGTAECALIISGNQLQGPAALASTLHKFRLNHVRISTLRLHKNSLGDEAMEALVEHIENAAEDGQPLMELHLSNNRITESGIRSLVEAAHRSGVYVGKRGNRPDGREDKRHAALWLRTENQRPAIQDPQGLLDRLNADGFPVALLPSKEWQPPPGKGGGPRQEGAVHMHHSFVRRDRRANEEWEDYEKVKPEKSKDRGDRRDRGDRGSDEWVPKKDDWDIASSEKSKGKGASFDARNSAKGGREEDWRSTQGGDGKGGKSASGKGKADAWYWYAEGQGHTSNTGWKTMWHAEKNLQEKGSWKGWGYNEWDNWDDDEEDDAPPPSRSRQHADERRGRDRDDRDRYQKVDHDRRSNRWDQGWDDEATHSTSQKTPLVEVLSSPARDHQSSRSAQATPTHPPGQFQWQQHSMGTAYPTAVMQPGFLGDITGSPWLSTAAGGVFKKLKDCQMLDILKRSLNPGSLDDLEWQRVATIGSQGIAAACLQRSSVVVGSFVPFEGLQELNIACSGQAGLATVFRHVQLRRLFPPHFIQDDHDEHKCASIVAAIYGDILETPMDGESAARENARRVAEWALLDFIFLLGVTRISFGFQSTSPGDAYREGVPGEPY